MPSAVSENVKSLCCINHSVMKTYGGVEIRLHILFSWVLDDEWYGSWAGPSVLRGDSLRDPLNKLGGIPEPVWIQWGKQCLLPLAGYRVTWLSNLSLVTVRTELNRLRV
jgi:hypothetical protein